MRCLYLTLPQHWAPALINGDYTGYMDEEVQYIEDFIDYMVDEYGSCHCIDMQEDENFTCWHDANHVGYDYGSTVNTFVFDITSSAQLSPQSSGMVPTSPGSPAHNNNTDND
jgi:hypothetical protein